MPALPKLTPEQWAALRLEYEAGHSSLKELAAKYGVSRAAIRKRAADTTQPGGAWKREEVRRAIDEAADRATAWVARSIISRSDDESEDLDENLEGINPEGSTTEGPTGESSIGEGSTKADHSGESGLKAQKRDRQGSTPEGFTEEGSVGEGSTSRFHRGRKVSLERAQKLKPSFLNPTTLAMADPAMRAAMREEIIEGVAEALARANSDHLEHRVGPLKTLYRRYLSLLLEAMTTPDPADLEAVERQARAQAVLLAGRSDTLGAHLQALIKLSESIQAQERRALGVEDRAKRVEVSGPGGTPIQAEHVHAGLVDLTKLTTAEMEALYEAARILEGKTERPGIPLPPGDE